MARVLLIGVDGAMPYFVRRFVSEGELPNIGRLIRRGVFLEAYPLTPCDTPTNWTTIATGATTARHGATSFNVKLPGEPLDRGLALRGRSFVSTYCGAEYIWDAADGRGLRSLIVNYIVGWPPKLRHGIMMNGSGIPPHQLADGTRSEVRLVGGRGLLRIGSGHIKKPVELEINLKGDELTVGARRLQPGRWSGWFSVDCEPSSAEAGRWNFGWISWWRPKVPGRVRGYFRVKVEEISGEGLRVRTTPIFTTLDWVHPEDLGGRLLEEAIGDDTVEALRVLSRRTPYLIEEEFEYLDVARAEAGRIAAVVGYVQEKFGWDLCMLHFHVLDSVNHRFLAQFVPESHWHSEEEARKALEHQRLGYKVVDELVGTLIDLTDEETTTVFVSDHAALPSWRVVEIKNAFLRSGLLAYRVEEGRFVVDWSRTEAFPCTEPTYVWVNLKGREPHGIVEEEKYEEVRERIIDCLLSVRDPRTGRRAVQLALRREEVGFLGQGGERCGDVVYFLAPGFQFWDGRLEDLDTYEPPLESFGRPDFRPSERITGSHVYYLPTARIGEFTNSSVLIMAGAGVKKAEVRRSVWLTDVAPTVAALLGIEPPSGCEGRTIREVLEIVEPPRP
ncbi:MAG TPA: hypothetical protein EYP61_07360 [Candidatus Latescibacteria bacterium]|nr:hypothetical protein [Candidatus Latescibacterota bacterium]